MIGREPIHCCMERWKVWQVSPRRPGISCMSWLYRKRTCCHPGWTAVPTTTPTTGRKKEKLTLKRELLARREIQRTRRNGLENRQLLVVVVVVLDQLE